MAAIDEAGQAHVALRSVIDRLGGTDVKIHNPNLIEFSALGTVIFASVKEGDARVRIRSYFLADAAPNDLGALEWAARQPSPRSGLLEVESYLQDGIEYDDPRLVFERPISSPVDGYLESDITLYVEAWRNGEIAPDAQADLTRFVFASEWSPPQNAWLLIGDETAYPDDDETEKFRKHGEVGIYDNHWTVSKNARSGDLVLIYFVAPRKAAHFIARLASNPYWRDDIKPNARTNVIDQQWWADLTPLVEIKPIPSREFVEAHDGHFMFKGRSGHYLRPSVFDRLSIVAKDPAQQSLVDRIAVYPTGLSELPKPEDMTFEQWRDIASGVLTLEAHVSEYIVEPFLKRNMLLTLVGGWEREYKVTNGWVDFVIRGNALTQDWDVPVAAIEVKLATQRPSDGLWLGSPDFRQLRRYMDALNVPGLLVDANTILFVERGADTPYLEIQRSDPSGEDLAAAVSDFQAKAVGHPIKRNHLFAGGRKDKHGELGP